MATLLTRAVLQRRTLKAIVSYRLLTVNVIAVGKKNSVEPWINEVFLKIDFAD